MILLDGSRVGGDAEGGDGSAGINGVNGYSSPLRQGPTAATAATDWAGNFNDGGTVVVDNSSLAGSADGGNGGAGGNGGDGSQGSTEGVAPGSGGNGGTAGQRLGLGRNFQQRRRCLS